MFQTTTGAFLSGQREADRVADYLRASGNRRRRRGKDVGRKENWFISKWQFKHKQDKNNLINMYIFAKKKKIFGCRFILIKKSADFKWPNPRNFLEFPQERKNVRREKSDFWSNFFMKGDAFRWQFLRFFFKSRQISGFESFLIDTPVCNIIVSFDLWASLRGDPQNNYTALSTHQFRFSSNKNARIASSAVVVVVDFGTCETIFP